MEEARGFLKRVINTIKKPEMRILPGQLAFFLIMTLIPLAALLGAITSTLSIKLDTIKELMAATIPSGVIDFISEIMNNKSPNFNIIVFFISAFVLASNGPHSMIITSNEIYKIESKDYISRRIKAIMMTFVMAGLFILLFLIPIFGDYIFEMITINIHSERLYVFIYLLYQLIKYPLLLVALYYNIKLLYTMAPDEKISSKTTRKGALFTTIGWIISSEIYSIYIGAFTNYDKFYGSISNIVILMIWVYIMSYIFVLGMVFNAGTYKKETMQMKVVEDK